MATITPIAYNPSHIGISGTTLVGDISSGDSSQDYGANPGGLRWWASPDQNIGYVIARPITGLNQPNPVGTTAGVAFWRSKTKTDEGFTGIASYAARKSGGTGPFSTVSEALTWLNDNGFWTSYSSYVSTDLILYLDSGDVSSYSGTGTVWSDLIGSNDATLINTPTYSSNFGGILQFDDAVPEWATIPDIGSKGQWTVESWFRLTTSLNSKVTAVVCNQYNLTNALNFSIGTNNAPFSYNLCAGFFDGAWRTTSGFAPSTGTWYQVVGTYDGSVIRQYVNGVASGGTLSYVGTPQSGGEIRLMRRWDSPGTSANFVDGDLAIVRIYDTALSSEQVNTNFQADRGRFSI